MKAISKAKDFDCVEMKNAIQAKIYAEIKDMTDEERLAYFNNPAHLRNIGRYPVKRLWK